MNRALFLDRDGTLIVHRPYLHRPDEVELLPGVSDALRAARAAGFLLFLFTNQSGVGRGLFTLADVDAVNARMIALIGLGADLFARVCIAPEAPDQPSAYRKPSPRFIRECIADFGLDPRECWMIGDNVSDWQAGLAAGIGVLAVQSDAANASAEGTRRALGVEIFANLRDAVAGAVGAEAAESVGFARSRASVLPFSTTAGENWITNAVHPIIALHAESLAGFSCPDWDGWIWRLFADGRAGLSFENSEADVRRQTEKLLRTRFSSFGANERSAFARANGAVAAEIWFGDDFPRATPHAAPARAVALRASGINRHAIARLLERGATHFLCDVLPDEIEADFSDPIFREWLKRFVFVPPGWSRGARGEDEPGTRTVAVCDRGDDAPGAEDFSAATRSVAGESGFEVWDAVELEHLCDRELAARLRHVRSVYLATRNHQLAHRIFLAAAERRIGACFSPELQISPLRFFGDALPQDAWVPAAPAKFGQLRRAAQHLRACIVSTAADTASQPDDAPGFLAAHILEAIAPAARQAGAADHPVLWRAHPAWDEWAGCAQRRAPTEFRARAFPFSRWMSQAGASLLLAPVGLQAADRAAARLWLEHFVVSGRCEFRADLYALIARRPDWIALAETVFARLAELNPELPDLRGPLAGALAELCWWNPEEGARLGVPDCVLRWLDADAAEGRQSPSYLLQRAMACARWREMSVALSLVEEFHRRCPGAGRAVAQIAATKLWSLREDCYFADNRSRLGPVLENLRRLLEPELGRMPTDAEAEKYASFLEILLGRAGRALQRLEQAESAKRWPPLCAAEFAMQFLYVGELVAARQATALLAARTEELGSPYELAFAAMTFELIARDREANGLYERLEMTAPGYFTRADPFLRRTWALVLAARGEDAQARATFWQAVAVRPALRSSLALMDATIARVRGNDGFRFSPADDQQERERKREMTCADNDAAMAAACATPCRAPTQ